MLLHQVSPVVRSVNFGLSQDFLACCWIFYSRFILIGMVLFFWCNLATSMSLLHSLFQQNWKIGLCIVSIFLWYLNQRKFFCNQPFHDIVNNWKILLQFLVGEGLPQPKADSSLSISLNTNRFCSQSTKGKSNAPRRGHKNLTGKKIPRGRETCIFHAH